MQYASGASRKHLEKLEERGETLPDFETVFSPEVLAHELASEDFWQLCLLASKVDSAVERAIASGEPAHVAKYAFQLAQAFNNFYHGYPVLQEQDPDRRAFLLWMTNYFRDQLLDTEEILGIEQPAYM